jgi:hypothetical protein
LEPQAGVRCNAVGMRVLAAALLLGLLLAGTAQGKLNPRFNERNAEPGDTLELDLGDGGKEFRGPLRIFLVSLEDGHRSQVKIGELGTTVEFGTPDVLSAPPPVLTFKVPNVPEGEYTVAIWFKESLTGTWANALEGIHPLLTLDAADGRAASPGRSNEQTGSPLWAVALAVVGIVAVVAAFGWRCVSRYPVTRVSAS